MNQQENSNTEGDYLSSPLITIATVTYNAARTLKRTLQSVAEQDYPCIEHIIIDGCSTDRTLSMVQRYVEENTANQHTIRLVCEPDEGLYDAMNKAIQHATGQYIVFLNAGDALHTTTTITDLVKKADWRKNDASNPAILYGETDLVDEQGNFLRHRRLRAPQTLHWKAFLSGMLVCHQSFYVRTDLAKEIPYDLKYRFSADVDWCIRIMKRAEKRHISIVNTGLILTDYLSEGMSTQHRRKSLMERFLIMTKHYGWATTLVQHAWFVIRALIR